MFEKISGVEKVYGFEGEGGSITVFRRKIFLLQISKNCWVKLRCLRKNMVSMNFMHKKGRSKFSTENYLSQSVKENRSGSLCGFTNILVPKKIWIREGELGSFTTLRLNFFLFVSEYR